MEAEDNVACYPITTSEAYHIMLPLKGRYKNTRSESYKIFKETLKYADLFGKIKEKSLADDLRQALVELGFSEAEIAAIGSLLPQSSNEAKICVPSITRLTDNAIESAIQKVQQVS